MCGVACVLWTPASARGSSSATADVLVRAQFASRTSLDVSADLLDFVIDDPAIDATVDVTFVAAARTHTNAEVVLTAEPVSDFQSNAGGPCALRFVGNGQGTTSGTLETGGPTVVGRWTGSGRRRGAVSFVLRASAAGRHTVPVRFVLSAP
jgi:hypothetical protein